MSIVLTAQRLEQRPKGLLDLHHLQSIAVGHMVQHDSRIVGIPQQRQHFHQNLRGLSVGVGVDGVEQFDGLCEVQAAVFDGVEGHFCGMAGFFGHVADVFVVGGGEDFVAGLWRGVGCVMRGCYVRMCGLC